MATGVIKNFNQKGFGFVKEDGGDIDVFYFIGTWKKSGMAGEPQIGQRITFDVEHGDRGPRAVNIRPA